MRLGLIVRDQGSCCLCQWKVINKNARDLEEMLVFHLTADVTMGGHGRIHAMICKTETPKRRGVPETCWEFTGPGIPRGWARELGR